MESQPALPWGVAADAQPTIIRDLPAHLKLAVGSARIEVYWMIEPEEEEEHESSQEAAYSKWWPATISRLDENANTDGEGRVAYILRYDPDPESGYDEETEHVVTFLDEHELFDLGEADILKWRTEGDDWNEVSKYKVVNGIQVVNLEDMFEEDKKLARLVGVKHMSAREEIASCMEDMPMDVQRIFADKLDSSLELFSQEVGKMMESVEQGGIVGLEDVQEMLENLKKRAGLLKGP